MKLSNKSCNIKNKFLIVALLFLTKNGFSNTAPVIDSVELSKENPKPGESITITVNAHDPDCPSICNSGTCEVIRRDLTSWSANGGTISYIDTGTTGSPYTTSATWVAPATTGTYIITVTIGDGGNPFTCGSRLYTSKEIPISVSLGEPPLIQSISLSSSTALPEESVEIMAQAFDPDGGELTWTWFSSGGTITGTDDSDPWKIEWIAPSYAGSFSITLTVSDPDGNSASRSIDIQVVPAIFYGYYSFNSSDITGIGINWAGEVYTSDPMNGKLLKISTMGANQFLTSVKGIEDVEILPDGEIIITSSTRGCIKKLSPDGKVIVEKKGFVIPQGIAYSKNYGLLYITDPALKEIFILNPSDLNVLNSFFTDGYPSDVAVSSDGNRIAVVDMANATVKIYDTYGNYQTSIGTFGNNPEDFVRPYGVAFDNKGWIYVSDMFSDEVKVFDSNYLFVGNIGGYGTESGKLRSPKDVEVDEFGRLFVVSSKNSRVEIYITNKRTSLDADRDGLPDAWELSYGLNPSDPYDAFDDSDSDNLLNIQEYKIGTSPINADTDDDGVEDGWEILSGLNPLDPSDNVPVPIIESEVPEIVGPSVIVLSAERSYDPNNDPLSFKWLVEGPYEYLKISPDGKDCIIGVKRPGNYRVKLFANDGKKEKLSEKSFTVLNLPPYAEAEDKKFVEPNRIVKISGKPSIDPNGEMISYKWEQISGPPVTISDPSSPEIYFLPVKEGIYKFKLTVKDETGNTATDESVVYVSNGGIPESIMPDKIFGEIGSPVILSGFITRNVPFKWEQIEGPAVDLYNADTLSPYFIPELPGKYVFRLSPENGIPAETTVIVNNSELPLAVCGGETLIETGTGVILDGSGSVSHSESATFLWKQISGPPIYIPDNTQRKIKIYPIHPGKYVFSLVVCSSGLCSLPCEQTVYVQNREYNLPAVEINAPDTVIIGEEIVVNADIKKRTESTEVWWDIKGEKGTAKEYENQLILYPAKEGQIEVQATPVDENVMGISDKKEIIIDLPERAIPVAHIKGGGMFIGGEIATLSAEESFDPKGKTLNYRWERIYGKQPEFLIEDGANISFLVESGNTYIFKLYVDNGRYASAPVYSAVAGADVILGVVPYEKHKNYTFKVNNGVIKSIEIEGGDLDIPQNIPLMVGFLGEKPIIEGSSVVDLPLYIAPEGVISIEQPVLKFTLYRALIGDIPSHALKIYKINGEEYKKLDTELDERADTITLSTPLLSTGKYAVVAEGIKSLDEKTGCFIATASYGFYDDKTIGLLRSFRDDILLKLPGGKKIVKMYYKYSPHIAEKIVRSEFQKWMIRMLLLPVILVLKFWFVILGFAFAAIRKEKLFVIAFIFSLTFSAYALDPPHSTINANDCQNCHTMHKAIGNILTTAEGNPYLCLNCHTSGGLSSLKPMNGEFQSTPGARGNSHSWAKGQNNLTYGAQFPLNQEMQLRIYDGKIVCSTCHNQHSQTNVPFDPNAPPSGNGRHYQRLNNSNNEMCLDCHRSRNVQNVRTYTGSYLSHPVGISYTGGDRRSAPLDYDGKPQQGVRFKENSTGDTNATNNFVLDASNKVNCMTCHGVHYTDGHPMTIDLR